MIPLVFLLANALYMLWSTSFWILFEGFWQTRSCSHTLPPHRSQQPSVPATPFCTNASSVVLPLGLRKWEQCWPKARSLLILTCGSSDYSVLKINVLQEVPWLMDKVVWCWSLIHLQSVCPLGSKHKTMVEARNGAGPIKSYPRPGSRLKVQNGNKGSGLQNKTFHCEICDVHVNSEIQLKQVVCVCLRLKSLVVSYVAIL